MDNRKTHPSFALVKFARQHGGARKLFGSQIRPSTTIVLEIRPGAVRHDLGQDWYSGEAMPIIEVELSPAQFAELLTTMNVGQGVPGTIRYFQGKRVEDVPEDHAAETQNIRKAFEEKLENLIEDLQNEAARVESLLKKKSVLSKADKETINWSIGKVIQEVQANMPFMLKSFNESAQQIVTQVKAEVDAFATHAITQVGLETLMQRRKELEDDSQPRNRKKN
jgi:ElaB/YqjD/DUF883 family membrane-anchored ribosome-binding protein